MRLCPSESVIALLQATRQTHRPRLLLRTARIGMQDYDRSRDLKRILRLPATPPAGPGTLAVLLELEALHEDRRTRPPAEIGNPWRAARHVEVLVALMAESRLLEARLQGDAPYLRPALGG